MYLLKTDEFEQKKKVVDEYIWFCNSCRKEKTCRVDSVFEGLKSPIIKIFKAIQYFCCNYLQVDICYDLDTSKNTITKWYKLMREIMQDHLISNPQLLGGLDKNGVKKIVEIDESLFFKRKYERGRLRPQQWVLGMVERDSKLCNFFLLPNRKGSTIIPLILENVQPETIIVTDCWTAYNRLREYSEFINLSVNHSINFLNPDDSNIHTQTIESCWGHVKRRLRNQHGTSSEFLEGYLYEYAFKFFFEKSTCFNEFICLLKDCLINS